MNKATPTVLLTMNSPAEQAELRRWLEAAGNWQIAWQEAGDESWRASGRNASQAGELPHLPSAPDIVLIDEPEYRAAGARLQAYWQPHAPLFVVLLETADEALATQVLAAGAADYLVKSQLQGTRLRQTLSVLWQQVQLQRSLQTCHRQNAFAQATIGISQAAPSGHFMQVNQYLCDLLGYSAAELLQLTYQDITHPDDLAAQADWVQQLLNQENETITLEKRYRAKAGHYIWTRVTLSAVKDEHNRLVSDLAIVENISDRRQLETQLRDSEAELRGLFEAMDDIVLVFDRRGTYLKVAPSGHDKLYRPPAALLGKTVGEILPKAVAQDVLRCIEQVLTSQQPQDLEYSLPVNGHPIWLSARCFPLNEEQAIWVARDISDRKQLELERQQAIAALAQSEAKFRALIENASEITYTRDLDGTLTYLSPQAKTILGYAPDELIGNQRWNALVHPEDTVAAQRHIEALTASGQPQRAVEVRVRHRDGHWHWMRTNIAPIFDHQGNLVGIQGASTSINHQKQAELTLQERQAQFETIYQQAAVGICSVGLSSPTILSANPWFCDLLGYSEAELRQMQYADYSHPEDMGVDDAWMAQLLAAEIDNYTLEKRYFRRSGEICWVSVTVFLVKDVDGRPLHSNAIVQNINERKQLEQARRQAEIARQENRDFLQTILDNLPISLFVKAASAERFGEFVLVNQLCETYFGCSREQIIGQTDYDLFPAQEADWYLASDEEVVTQRTKKQLEEICDRPHLGRQILQTAKVPIFDAAGQPRYLLGISQDITDRKAAELNLQASERKHRALVEALPDLIIRMNSDGYYLDFFAAANMTVLEGDGLVGCHLYERGLPRDLAEQRMGYIRQALETGQLQIYEQTLFNGKKQAIEEVRVVPSGDNEILIIVRDITDRKQAELDRQQTQLELEQLNQSLEDQVRDRTAVLAVRERELNSIFSAAAAGIAQIDPESHQFLKVNEYFCDLLGYSKKELLALNCWQLPHDDYRDRCAAYIEQLCRHEVEQFSLEQPLMAQDGSLIWVDMSMSAVWEASGELRYYILVVVDITERKQAELQLQDSEARLRATFAQAAVGIVQVNLQGQIIKANAKFCEIVGYAEADLQFCHFGEITHPDDLTADQTLMARVMAGEMENFVMEKRYIHQSGHVVWANLAVSIIRDEAGENQYWIAIVQDISDRKRVEQQLQAERLRLQVALEAAQMGTWESNLEAEIWSEQTEAIFGFAAGTFPGDRTAFSDRLHPDDRDWVLAASRANFLNGQPHSLEYRIYRLDGELRWVAVQAKALPSADRADLKVVGVVRDITERKQAEEALRDSEERLRLALNASNQGLYDLDLRTGQEIVSATYATMLGYDPISFHETNAKWLQRLHPDDRDHVGAVYRAYVAGDIGEYRVEFRQRMNNGDWKWLLSVGKIVDWDEQGNPLRLLGTHTDIDDLKQAEDRVRTSEERFRQLAENINEVFWLTDHDHEILYVSPAYEAVWGRQLADINRDTFFASIHLDDRDRVISVLNDVRQTSPPAVADSEIEYRIRRPDGTIRWIRARISPVRDEQGCVYRITGVSEDITERKQADIEVQKLAAVVENSTDMIGIATLQGETLYINAAGRQLLGLPENSELVSKPITDYVSPAALPQFEQETIPAVRATGAWSGEVRLCHQQTAADIVVEQTIFLIRDPQSNDPLFMATIVRDIRNRKAAELALRESQQFTQSITENTPNLIYIYDLIQQCNVYCNQEIARMLGHTAEDLQGMRDNLLPSVIHPDDLPILMQGLQTVAAAADRQIYEFEYRIRHANGEWRWLYDRMSPFRRDAAGNVTQYIGLAQDISDRKAAETALRESQQFAQSITENTPNLIYIYDLPRQCNIYCNQEISSLLGYSVEAVQAMADSFLASVIHLDDLPKLIQGQQAIAAAADQQICEFEYRVRHADGTWRWFYDRVSPFQRDAAGNVTQYIGLAQDISDRKAAELALRESQQFTQSITENTPNIIYIYDLRQQRNLYCNQEIAKMLGYSVAEIQAMGDRLLPKLIHPDDLPTLMQGLQAVTAAADQQICEFEYRSRHADGTWRWFYDRISPFLRDEAGEVIQYIGLAQDITDRKQLEAEQARLIRILEAAPDHIGMAKPDGTVIWNNRQAKILSGLPLNADVTQIPMNAYHPAWALELIQGVGIPTAIQEDIWVGETALVNRGGDEIPTSQLILAHKSSQGEVEYISTIIRDISSLKQAEQILKATNAELEVRVAERTTELVEARDAAESANRAKSKFLANMSHELRTPLNAILGFSQLMGRDRTLSPKQMEELQIINRSGEQLLTLINDILETAKIEAEQILFTPTSCELPLLLDSLFDTLRLKAEAKGLDFSVSRHPDVPRYIGTDSRKLRQVLLNLLNNAVKFTAAGQVTLDVKPGHPTPPKLLEGPFADANGVITMLHFAVTDRGEGIAPEELDLLFEPFVQTASGRRSQEGTGLGLPISRQYVQLMGGTLAVQSQPGSGSTFSFAIPVQVMAAEDVEGLATRPRAIAIAPDQPNYRLLVVEDNRANRRLLQTLLSNLGFEVQTAVNGQEAIELWHTWQPHLIFMDIRMPVMTGIEATQAIRQREPAIAPGPAARPPTKIISLTAGVVAADQAELTELGFDGLIYKPITEAEITQAIAAHLGVQYLYESEATPPPVAPARSPETPLTLEHLQTLPRSWIHRLHEAILQLNQEQLLALIAELPESQANLAQVLNRKVHNFEYEALLDLAQTILDR